MSVSRYAARSSFSSVWERRLGRTESPIEGELLAQFCSLSETYGYRIAKRSGAHEGVICVRPQHPIGRYWADFGVSYHFFGHDLAMAVECDGHDFHERTKAQASRDKKRDRFMQQAGYEVFRFTGSEIRANPSKCAMEVLNAIMAFQTACFVRAFDAAQEEAA